jgi:SAM-dependent methyltransferase
MTTNAAEPLTPERLMQFAWGYAPILIIAAALRHGVFDLLDRGPRPLAQLVAETGTSVRGLTAILNALVGLKLLARVKGGYALTPESATFLVSSKPDYRGQFFQHHTEQLLPQWQHLAEVVRTGKPVARTNRELDGGEYFARFVESLFPGSYPAAHALGQHLGIPKATAPVSVLDIGAGSGVWGIALAKQSSYVRLRAVDWPPVLEVTRKVAARHGVADRLTTVAGDLFEADFGEGHQVAVLGHILHSEGPDRCRRLLQKTFAALAPGGTLAVQEFVPDQGRTGPPQPLIFAVNMLVNTEAGDTYTFEEMSAWLHEAGYRNPRLLDVPAPSALVLADKPRV